MDGDSDADADADVVAPLVLSMLGTNSSSLDGTLASVALIALHCVQYSFAPLSTHSIDQAKPPRIVFLRVRVRVCVCVCVAPTVTNFSRVHR